MPKAWAASSSNPLSLKIGTIEDTAPAPELHVIQNVICARHRPVAASDGPGEVIHRLGWPQGLSLIGLIARIVVLDPNIAVEDVPGR